MSRTTSRKLIGLVAVALLTVGLVFAAARVGGRGPSRDSTPARSTSAPTYAKLSQGRAAFAKSTYDGAVLRFRAPHGATDAIRGSRGDYEEVRFNVGSSRMLVLTQPALPGEGATDLIEMYGDQGQVRRTDAGIGEAFVVESEDSGQVAVTVVGRFRSRLYFVKVQGAVSQRDRLVRRALRVASSVRVPARAPRT